MKITSFSSDSEKVYSYKQTYSDNVFKTLDKSKEALVASGELGKKFIIPVLIPEGKPSGDDRTFKKGAITVKDLPMPLLWQESSNKGHDGAVIVGRIDSVEPLEEGGWGNATGYFDTGVYGKEAQRLVENRFLQGVSADMDNFEASIEYEDDDLTETAVTDAEGSEEMKDALKKNVETIKNDKITVNRARLIAATLVSKPAFSEAYITIADDEDPEDVVEEIMDGEYVEETDDKEMIVASLIASAAPVVPPRSWFKNPELDGPTPIRVEDDGRVFGHIAAWNTSHIGLPGNTRPPRSASDYAYFRTGVVRADDGTDVPVGQLTLAGGHASIKASAAEAVKHYDDTASAIADVTVGEDAHGIWVAGALRPEATPEQVRALRASAPSGDWRPINGRLELVAVCQVNVPGFPVARAMIASGEITALVAAGANVLAQLRTAEERTVEELASRVTALELKANEERKKIATERLQTFAAEQRARMSEQKANDPLVAAAAKAKKRIAWLKEQQ